MKSFTVLFAVTTASAGLLLGCAGRYSELEQRFGESVRTMETSQRYIPAAAASRPQGHGPLDADKAGAILEAYRTDISKPQEVTNEIRIRVDGQ